MAWRIQALCRSAYHDDALAAHSATAFRTHLTGEGDCRKGDLYGKETLNKEFAMLTKAIFTGVILAGLSGSIVYFGTEGADALENDNRNDTRVEETELAGAAVEEADIIKTVEGPVEKPRVKKPQIEKEKKPTDDTLIDETLDDGENNINVAAPIDPPAEPADTKAKTKWLDQYLKSNKSDKDAETALTVEMEESKDSDSKDKDHGGSEHVEVKSLAIDAQEDGSFRYSDGTIVEDEEDLKHVRQALEAIAGLESAANVEDSYDDEKAEQGKEVRKKVVIKIDGEAPADWATYGEDIDIKLIEELLNEDKAAKKDIRILRLDGETSKMPKPRKKVGKKIDYDRVLDEARKLQVIDMRNLAFFEIIDYAIDRRNFGQAADVLQELSDPELRDTARAKIGVGLAKAGDSDAAFAVLDEMEIDELTASMRLEIITALMATKAERAAPSLRR